MSGFWTDRRGMFMEDNVLQKVNAAFSVRF
jgi:hypothetical protein